jgi:major membrane immunogen (membrane-anchored lipoprotein)
MKHKLDGKEDPVMRKPITIALLAFAVLIVGCGHNTFHQGAMPDPGPYMIHFHELDADGNDTVSWEEFKDRFPDSTEDVFKAVDQDGDGLIDHDEWHTFKEAHGAE